MLIAYIATKGGVGKSTLALNTACCAAREGLSVLVVDADEQKSSLYWRSIRPDDLFGDKIQVVSMPTKAIHKDLPALSAAYDITIIDCGGRDSSVLRSSIIACGKGVVKHEGGIALTMVGSSQFDAWGFSDTLDALEEARSLVDISSYVMLNNSAHGTRSSKNTLNELSTLENISLLQSQIHTRVAFKNATERGLGVIESEPRGKAAKEIMAFWQELKGIHRNLLGGCTL